VRGKLFDGFLDVFTGGHAGRSSICARVVKGWCNGFVGAR
jgi:hypothetical protein